MYPLVVLVSIRRLDTVERIFSKDLSHLALRVAFFTAFTQAEFFLSRPVSSYFQQKYGTQPS